jgi:FMN phosphatase YigB (HAD superfamily)
MRKPESWKLKRPKAIVYDGWNTTILIRSIPVEPLKDVARLLGLELDRDKDLKQRFLDWGNSCTILHLQQYLDDAAKRFGREVPPDAADKLWEIMKNQHRGLATYDDVEEVLQQVKAAGIRQGLFSNTNSFSFQRTYASEREECPASPEEAELNKKLPTLKIAPLLEHMLFSCDPSVGVAKPDPRAFGIIADRFHLPPSDMWYVGDDFYCDVDGSRSAGMQPILCMRAMPEGDTPEKKAEREALEAKIAQYEDAGVPCIRDLRDQLVLLGIQPTKRQPVRELWNRMATLSGFKRRG